MASPISQEPCAWWRCRIYAAYVDMDIDSIEGGERQVAELVSGNQEIVATGQRAELKINLEGAHVIPRVVFKESVNALETISAGHRSFLESLRPEQFDGSGSFIAPEWRGRCGEVWINVRTVEETLPLDGECYFVARLGGGESAATGILIGAGGEREVVAYLTRRRKLELLLGTAAIGLGTIAVLLYFGH
ncbi:MAG TPA: hypothetical protein VM598_11735 [Bdellovibrionota bacterium]|nr:hypothetical protein [Bdellovibrionota bacterium]